MLFFYRLRLRCPAEWERLGSPDPFLPEDVATGWRLTKYIMRAGFGHLEDRGLIALGRVLCVLEWVWTVGWAVLVGLALIAILLSWFHLL